MLDGPRLNKLKLAYNKMIEQVCAETGMQSTALTEELLSVFRQTLLKYSVPAKLNELDKRIATNPPKCDITNEDTIHKVLESYTKGPCKELINTITEEENRLHTETDKATQQEQKIEQEIQNKIEDIKKWIEGANKSIEEIKRAMR